MTTELKIYRRSELEAVADGCLRRYDALWRRGVEDTSDLALVGIGGHSVKYHYIQRLVDKQIPQDAEEANAAFVEGIAAAQTPARLIPEIKKIWDFHVPHFELPLERFVAAEERQSSGGIGFTPDLVLAHPERNELEIVDDKWGWAPPITEDALRSLFQARVYSRFGFDRWPNFLTYRFTIHAVRFGKYASVTFTQSELDSVDVELQAAIATIQRAEVTDHWPAVPGPACAYCSLVCPVVDEPMNLPARLTRAEQAAGVGRWLLPVGRAVTVAKKALKAYCSTNGAVDVEGMRWDHYPVENTSYPLPKVLELFRAKNLMGGLDDLTISKSALAKAFKAFPVLEKELAGVATVKPSYRFMAKKPGVDSGDDE